ncbi:MAG: hypothetical protein U0K19_04970 [Bifidobacteriaceae bacterium]|nr:hypothetical protein [Bifidobacteriaceae bacterium]
MKTVADVLHWEPFLESDQIEALKAIAPPARIGGIDAPQDLNDLTLGQLIQLESIGAEKGVFAAIAVVLLGKDEAWAAKAPAMEMLGLRNMVVKEQNHIAGLFQSLSHEPDAAEVMAGIDKLNFGMFGLADWYARRMGISDHDEAFNTPWLRIWQCRKNDHDEAEYQKRLQKIRTNMAKSQSKR